MQSQPDAAFLGHRDHRFQEIRGITPHLIETVRPFLRKRRQVLDAVVIVRRQPCASPSDFLVISLHNAVRTDVVLHHWQSSPARGANGLLNLLYLLVSSRLSIKGVRKT